MVLEYFDVQGADVNSEQALIITLSTAVLDNEHERFVFGTL